MCTRSYERKKTYDERDEERRHDRQVDGCLAPVPSSYFLIVALAYTLTHKYPFSIVLITETISNYFYPYRYDCRMKRKTESFIFYCGR